MVTTKADLSALTELAGQFGVISNNLSNLGQEISAPGAYGNGDLEGEVSSFVSGWSSGRSEIEKGVENLSKMLTAAAGTYDRTEQSIIGEANKDRAAISGGPNGSTR
jgi:uncharacterized protein YukE